MKRSRVPLFVAALSAAASSASKSALTSSPIANESPKLAEFPGVHNTHPVIIP
jgi:hypothetical protein